MLISLFSDASLCHDQHVGGWAAWLKSDRGGTRAGAAFGIRVRDTSLAEAMAVVNGLTMGVRTGVIHDGDVVLVQTDNNAVMSVLTGTARRQATPAVKKRRKMSWRRLKREVRDSNIEIDAISSAFSRIVEANGIEIRWRHVKGHSGIVDARSAVNRYCDKVAKQHMRLARGRSIPTYAQAVRARSERQEVRLAA